MGIAQIKAGKFELSSALSLLRLYNLSPDQMDLKLVGSILVQALLRLPQPDFNLAMLLIPERMQVISLDTSMAYWSSRCLAQSQPFASNGLTRFLSSFRPRLRLNFVIETCMRCSADLSVGHVALPVSYRARRWETCAVQTQPAAIDRAKCNQFGAVGCARAMQCSSIQLMRISKKLQKKKKKLDRISKDDGKVFGSMGREEAMQL